MVAGGISDAVGVPSKVNTHCIIYYRVGQINPHKFQMVVNTYTKRNSNISFMHVIVYIHSSQEIVMFNKSTKIIEWSKQKEMSLLKNAARGHIPAY